MEGFIKLFRHLLDEPVFQNPNLWQVYSYLYLKASYKERNIPFAGEQIIIRPGQSIIGRFEGSNACNMKPSTFRDQISKLKRLKLIDTRSDNKKTVVTIMNWKSEQTGLLNSDIKPDNRPTSIRHKQESKNDKNIYSSEFEDLWTAYPRKQRKVQAFETFNSMNLSPEQLLKLHEQLQIKKDSQEWKNNGGQFVPSLSNWLNDEPWKEDQNNKILEIK